VIFINECIVKLKRDNRIKLVTCLPKLITPDVIEDEPMVASL